MLFLLLSCFHVVASMLHSNGCCINGHQLCKGFCEFYCVLCNKTAGAARSPGRRGGISPISKMRKGCSGTNVCICGKSVRLQASPDSDEAGFDAFCAEVDARNAHPDGGQASSGQIDVVTFNSATEVAPNVIAPVSPQAFPDTDQAGFDVFL